MVGTEGLSRAFGSDHSSIECRLEFNAAIDQAGFCIAYDWIGKFVHGFLAIDVTSRIRLRGVGAKVCGAVAVARTQHHALCQSDTDQAGSGMQPIMNTDSELLLEAGVATGKGRLLTCCSGSSTGSEATSVQRFVIKWVSAHRRRMLETLGMPVETDFATFERLGNTGSVALPTALGVGLSQAQFHSGTKSALLGIGSGLNSVMMGIEFGKIAVRGD